MVLGFRSGAEAPTGFRKVCVELALLFTGASNERRDLFRLPLELRGIGAPNCQALVSIDILLTTITDNSGNASVTLVVPNEKVLTSLLFFQQTVALEAAANKAGLTFSNGGIGQPGDSSWGC